MCHDSFAYAARRSQQEAVAAINATEWRAARAHAKLAVLHAARAVSLARSAESSER
ncbi:hypothetical protein GCM10011380_23090 [Sphingomonas metalli]|uniref:Uncharacterized protein n=1 Tax=Sphingomonas metalli TaxID=1779358 RepID=A0A916WTJ2_9SPHN|nr:hypothetical protein [Sphingomonas metalli]GGB33013.1 hypothetical protein GCM10011380_23090 [Sphingomonas metalli]